MSTNNGGSEGGDGDVPAAASHQGGGGVDMHATIHNGGSAKGGGGDGNGETHLKKGPWTAEEDAILVEYVRKHGEGNWNAVQRHWIGSLWQELQAPLGQPPAAQSQERTPPILQTPIRFKRLSSSPNMATLTTTNNPSSASSISPNSHFSLPLSPLPHASPSNTGPLGHQIPSCFTSSEFHDELQRDNQEMCSLLAALTQPELPSNQFLSATNQNRNLGIGIATTVGKFGRRATKKKIGNLIKDKVNGNLGLALEDLLQEAKALAEFEQTATEHSSLVLQEQKPKLLDSDGFGLHWDQSSSHALSSGLEPRVDVAGQLNAIPEDFSKVLNALPSPMQPELYSDSVDISNGPSSIITDDNIGFEMQQIASLFPLADNGRTLGSCSWDNLPGIC
ncbi:hypothetical protein GH714_007555 [Hevea brasiliensis]|uniref:Uncharacterized protein n=1 Tax=Hevea brasiliensis TaxID=3981 RepID=A0A6A6KA77_HEVBR|nr:hypothetical protein GH714_007555 [Hevea brasiliensis]